MFIYILQMNFFTKQRYLFFEDLLKKQISETYIQLQYCCSHLSRFKTCHVTTAVDGKELRSMHMRLYVVILMFELV